MGRRIGRVRSPRRSVSRGGHMPWNRWPHHRGIRGHMFMDSMATCAWNTQAGQDRPAAPVIATALAGEPRCSRQVCRPRRTRNRTPQQGTRDNPRPCERGSMTFVTKVPCAHVTGAEMSLFFYSDKSQSHARKGQWRHNLCKWIALYPAEHNAYFACFFRFTRAMAYWQPVCLPT